MRTIRRRSRSQVHSFQLAILLQYSNGQSIHYSHFLETQHCYAMQLGNSRVWDYVGDNFVHRLLQNKADGKLVEVEGNNNGRQFAPSMF